MAHPFFIPSLLTDSVTSTLVCLEADDSLRADTRVVNEARWQVETVTCFQGQLLAKLGQAKGDAAAHNVNHFVIRM